MNGGFSAGDYDPSFAERAKSTCLTLVQIFGETMTKNDIVVVGGLVPSLLFAGTAPHPTFGAHVGTRDVDVALSLVLLEEERYKTVRELLVEHGFQNDQAEEGRIVRQRWILPGCGVEIDFLMPLDPPEGPGAGRPQHFTKDFAAIKMLGLDLAIEHRQFITLSGNDLSGTPVTRSIPVCRAEILIVLKAIALVERVKDKDSYDLCFVLRNIEGGPSAAGQWLKALPHHFALERMKDALQQNFKTIDDVGPTRLARFIGDDSPELRADGLALVLAFLGEFLNDAQASA